MKKVLVFLALIVAAQMSVAQISAKLILPGNWDHSKETKERGCL